MAATDIAAIRGRQILDSRGRPTVEAEVVLVGGATARASSPSGASRGAAEAFELRDGDPDRHQGLGVLRAVAGINGEIRDAVVGVDVLEQAKIDGLMRDLDGTPQLSRLGGNAVLAVSLAVSRAGAAAAGQPLYVRIADLAGVAHPTLPMPMVNILSGGVHARGGMDVQDVLVVPLGAGDYAQALDWVSRVRDAADVVAEGMGLATLLADEGGLSPGFADTRDALRFMLRAFEAAKLRPGEDVAIGLDVAASGLVQADGDYRLERLGLTLTADEMIGVLADWARDYPVVSIEDGLGEEDWANWLPLTRRLGAIQLIGDDLFATQPDRIRRGVDAGAANSVLIKVNQNGTLTGALEALAQARRGGYAPVISARSGETGDSFIADVAVGTAGGQIKIGSLRNTERLAKYNRLSRIAEDGLAFAGRAALAGRSTAAHGD